LEPIDIALPRSWPSCQAVDRFGFDRSPGRFEPFFPVRRLAVLLIADAHGYCRLMATDEALAYATLVAHRRIMQVAVATHGGRTVGGAGDSLLAEFGSVEQAMRAALAMQDRLYRANQQLSPQHRLHFRLGLNLGDVLDDGDDLHGHSVNIAARLQTLAAPGGIALSAAVREQIGDRMGVSLRDGGWRRVKNIAEPLRVFHIDGGGNFARTSEVGRSRVRHAVDSAITALAAASALVL
jgi:adenylate cyclase